MTAVNNRSRKHSRKNSRRKLKKQFTIFMTTLFIVIACCAVFGSLYSQAHDKNTCKGTCYTSITINQGDTLWSIAEEYMTDDYKSVQHYINDIKKINGLTGDDIQSGMKLVVAYDNNQMVGSAK